MTHGNAPAEFCRDGLTIHEIAQEMGISYDAARFALRRRGLKAKPETALDHSDRIQRMTQAEAVDYLLGVVDRLLGAKTSPDPLASGWAGALTKSERRVLRCLMATPGCTVSKQAIYDALYYDCLDGEQILKIVDVFVCKLRRKMPGHAGRIVTVWGLGYTYQAD